MANPAKEGERAESADESVPHFCALEYRVSCNDCRLNSICLPIALKARDIDRLDQIVDRGRLLHKGDFAYHDGQPFSSVFALRSGALKTYKVTGEGKELVTGFYFPGEVFGVDGISQNRHVISARALETSAICEIPFRDLESLSSRLPSLQRHFFRLMSQEITQDQQLITLLSKSSAEQRVATLLLNISHRCARLKRSPTAFRLPMSRTDIANYLGLTVETVSRIFGRFQRSGLIEVEKKELRLCDLGALQALAAQ